MGLLLMAVVGVLAVELLVRMPLVAQIRALLGLLTKTWKVLTSSRISEHWKERVLLIYAGKMALINIRILLYFLTLLIVLYLFLFAAQALLMDGLFDLLLDPLGLSVMTGASVLYYFLRTRYIVR